MRRRRSGRLCRQAQPSKRGLGPYSGRAPCCCGSCTTDALGAHAKLVLALDVCNARAGLLAQHAGRFHHRLESIWPGAGRKLDGSPCGGIVPRDRVASACALQGARERQRNPHEGDRVCGGLGARRDDSLLRRKGRSPFHSQRRRRQGTGRHRSWRAPERGGRRGLDLCRIEPAPVEGAEARREADPPRDRCERRVGAGRQGGLPAWRPRVSRGHLRRNACLYPAPRHGDKAGAPDHGSEDAGRHEGPSVGPLPCRRVAPLATGGVSDARLGGCVAVCDGPEQR